MIKNNPMSLVDFKKLFSSAAANIKTKINSDKVKNHVEAMVKLWKDESTR